MSNVQDENSSESQTENQPLPHVSRFPKDERLWASNVTELVPNAQNLIEKYGGLSAADALPHAFASRDKAWDIAPYGSVGLLGFTNPSILTHPMYPKLLNQLKTSPTSTFLDLGCGFAQNIRQLILDGVPDTQLYGSDLSAGLINCGYEYFRDRDSLQSKFLVGDVFDTNSDVAKEATGKFDFIWAANFFHLWDWKGQVEASVNASKLLKPQPGSMLVGWQMGASPARESVFTIPRNTSKSSDDAERSGATMKKRVFYIHDKDSIARLWEEVGRITGTEWKVEAMDVEAGDKFRQTMALFFEKGMGMIKYSVERIN